MDIQEEHSYLLNVIKKEKVMTIEQLNQLLNCSSRTAQRRLKQWQAYRSYNQNGRFYTLPDIAKFDEQGLWKYKDVFFSQYGNLKDTVIRLVENSIMGLEASEIGEILGLLPRSFMSHFRSMPGLCREKCQGRFVYFSDKQDIYVRQKRDRRQLLTTGAKKLPPDSDAVLILVDQIKHPHCSIEQCAMRLRKKVKHIRIDVIYALLDYHGLLKKTRDTHS